MRAKKTIVSPLNDLLVLQIKKTGVEVQIFQGDRPKYLGLRRINPVEKLYNEGVLTREEWCAAEKYQDNYSEGAKDYYTKPKGVYSGLPLQKTTFKSKDKSVSSQAETRAREYVDRVKKHFFSNPSLDYECINFKWQELRLLEILELMFEMHVAIRVVERVTGINHADIPARAKKICEILLEINERK